MACILAYRSAGTRTYARFVLGSKTFGGVPFDSASACCCFSVSSIMAIPRILPGQQCHDRAAPWRLSIAIQVLAPALSAIVAERAAGSPLLHIAIGRQGDIGARTATRAPTSLTNSTRSRPPARNETAPDGDDFAWRQLSSRSRSRANVLLLSRSAAKTPGFALSFGCGSAALGNQSYCSAFE